MAASETPIAKIERLLRARDPVGALQVANDFLEKSPGSFLAMIGRCRANLHLRNYVDAEIDIERALQLSPKDDHANLLRANMDNRLGRIDLAIDRLRPIAQGRGPHAIEAAINLAEMYFYTGRRSDMIEMVKAGGLWSSDPRALIVRARVRVLDDFDGGIADMTAIMRSSQPIPLRRISGFEAVGLLDKKGRYREAFDLAREAHATTGGPCELDEWLVPLREQLSLLASKGRGWITPRVEPVQGVAMVVAMPRSGTTLLEQMLDRHPSIGGIGEFDGLDTLTSRLQSAPSWPRLPAALPTKLYADAQRHYLDGARQIRKAGATWTFDKSLLSWRALPEIAATLPGTVCIHIDRDPRDMATSQFLSYFNPVSYSWTQRFDLIRQMIEMERKIVPIALETLGLSYESFIYEDLIENPQLFAGRCLARMGLEMDERVLTPEQNKRGAFTLSHAQVRQPINRSSIGRWKNYEWAFDSSWDKLVEQHHARRTITPAND